MKSDDERTVFESCAGARDRGELALYRVDRFSRGLLGQRMQNHIWHTALDLDELSQIIDRRFGVVVILQLDQAPESPAELLGWTTRRINHPNRPCIFGICDVRLGIPPGVALQCGFAAVSPPGWRLQHLVDVAQRHWEALDWPPETLEDTIRRWMPFSNQASASPS